MKKFLGILGLMLLLQLQSFGDTWTVKRSWCGGTFHKKYQAYAKISSYWTKKYKNGVTPDGRKVYGNPIIHWYDVCNHNDKGCSRPRVAECNVSGFSYDQLWDGNYLVSTTYDQYIGYCKITYPISGVPMRESNVNYRASAGLTGEYLLDSAKFENLNRNGNSKGKIEGDVDIDDNGLLTINNLKGNLNIGKLSDFYSKFKFLIIKERDDESDTEAARTDSLADLCIFENVVYSSEVNVTNGKITQTGIFENINNQHLTIVNNDSDFGINFNGITLTKNLNISLKTHEHLTVVTILDGGFDISSAIIPPPQALAGKTMSTNLDADIVSIYPNPSSNGLFNITAIAESDDSNITINTFDFSGRDANRAFTSKLHKGVNNLNPIDLSNLPKGTYLLQIKMDDKISYKKITIL